MSQVVGHTEPNNLLVWDHVTPEWMIHVPLPFLQYTCHVPLRLVGPSWLEESFSMQLLTKRSVLLR